MNGTILTKAGEADLLNAPLLQKKVHWTSIAVGDANGSEYIPVETQTELKNQVWTGSISDVQEIEPGHLEFHTVIPADVGPFEILEAGVFNEQGALVAVAPVEKQYKASITGTSGTSNDLDFIIEIIVGNTESLEITIDPNTVIATRRYVENYVDQKLENFEAYELTEIQNDEIDSWFFGE